MLTAKTTIIVGKKIYAKGQTVTGLPKIDRKWMKLAGLIEETAGKKESKKSEEAKDGL